MKYDENKCNENLDLQNSYKSSKKDQLKEYCHEYRT